jgi:hypothetical protein
MPRGAARAVNVARDSLLRCAPLLFHLHGNFCERAFDRSGMQMDIDMFTPPSLRSTLKTALVVGKTRSSYRSNRWRRTISLVPAPYGRCQ